MRNCSPRQPVRGPELGKLGPARTHPGYCPHTRQTSPVPVCTGNVRGRPDPAPLLPGAMGGAAPPPCSRPHPLKEQEGEVGNTTALLCKQKGSRGRVVEKHWGE